MTTFRSFKKKTSKIWYCGFNIKDESKCKIILCSYSRIC